MAEYLADVGRMMLMVKVLRQSELLNTERMEWKFESGIFRIFKSSKGEMKSLVKGCRTYSPKGKASTEHTLLLKKSDCSSFIANKARSTDKFLASVVFNTSINGNGEICISSRHGISFIPQRCATCFKATCRI